MNKIEPNILISCSLFLSSLPVVLNYKNIRSTSFVNKIFGIILGFLVGSIISPYNFKEKIDSKISFIRTMFLIFNFLIYAFFSKNHNYTQLFWYLLGVWTGFIIFSYVQYKYGKVENRWYKYSDYTIYLLYINLIFQIFSFYKSLF